ncbi:MAG: hypothetical protein K2W82_15700 [Candidatus Obscuribacterales bacterium]|nr:hypothetical protein [Candidatus Obscuribacterales bacterium]
MHRFMTLLAAFSTTIAFALQPLQAEEQSVAPAQQPAAVTTQSACFQKYVSSIKETDRLQKLETELLLKRAAAEQEHKTARAEADKIDQQFRAEVRKAISATGSDPVAAFAEARKLQPQRKAAFEKSFAAWTVHNDLAGPLYNTRQSLKENSAFYTRQRINNEIANPLYEYPFSAKIEYSVRALENQFVQELKAASPNKQLQNAISEYEKVLPELEAKAAAYEKLQKYTWQFDYPAVLGNDDYELFGAEAYYASEEVLFDRASELLSKEPLDANSANAHKNLQEQGQELIQSRADAEKAWAQRDDAFKKLRACEKVYETTFQKVVLSAP